MVGIQSFSAKGRVPDIEATPGRFQGPKISQRLRAVATKLRPRPPNISLTPPKVLRAPARRAQSAPPRIPAAIAAAMIHPGARALSCRRRIAQVAKMAPRVICPSMPMFHRPTVKVKSTPETTRRRGTQDTTTFAATLGDPTAPCAMLR